MIEPDLAYVGIYAQAYLTGTNDTIMKTKVFAEISYFTLTYL